MQNAYTNQAKVEAYLDRDLTTKELLFFSGIVDIVSGFISTYTGRSWSAIGATPSATPAARYYDGEGGKRVYVDDFKTLTKLELLDSQGSPYLELTTASDFVLYPLNNETKETIYLRNYRLPHGPARIRVTADFNNVALPEGIILAATILASSYVTNSSTGNTEFKKESIEGYSYELQQQATVDTTISGVLSSLDTYKKVLL